MIDGKVKIIKNSFYKDSSGDKSIVWDTSNSNDWDRPATLKTELNGSGFYGNTNYIDETIKSYIANGTWYTGGQKGSYVSKLWR